MSKFKYQMHTHTSPCSHCARMTPDELTRALHNGGYQGAVLTNHFYWGNSGIDRDLPWDEFVRAYENDYIECVNSAKKFDLDILFGIEEGLGGGREILCYGITPEILYENPKFKERRAEDWYKALHEAGAVVIQAHPFRDREYITDRGVFPHNLIDGIEVFNRGNNEGADEEAENYAEKNPDLIFTSGSDAHIGRDVCRYGIATESRIRNEKELARVLKSKKYELIKE